MRGGMMECVRCGYDAYYHSSSLCARCRARLDALAEHLVEQAAAEKGVSLVRTPDGIVVPHRRGGASEGKRDGR